MCLAKFDNESPITASELHPDGLIFITGDNEGMLKVWDLPNQKKLLDLEGSDYTIKSIAISEDGVHLATIDDNKEQSIAKLWDLRKPNNSINIQLPDDSKANKLRFNSFGNYLGVAGVKTSIFNIKSLTSTTIELESSSSDIAFGINSTYIATSSLDRNLRLYY